MKITGAIFDMDGTLMNSMDYWAVAASEYLRSKGITPFDYDDKHFLEDGMRVWYQSAVENHGLTEPYETVAGDIYAIMDKYYNNDVKLKDGVPEMLQRLKAHGVKMCIASATDKEYVEKILTRLGIIDYFSEIFTSRSVGLGKRYPLIYEKALEFLGTDRETTYVFEDAHYAICTCRNNGFKVVGVYDKNAFISKEELSALCDYFIDENDNYEFEIE